VFARSNEIGSATRGAISVSPRGSHGVRSIKLAGSAIATDDANNIAITADFIIRSRLLRIAADEINEEAREIAFIVRRLEFAQPRRRAADSVLDGVARDDTRGAVSVIAKRAAGWIQRDGGPTMMARRLLWGNG
jgi:hypothetical protein